MLLSKQTDQNNRFLKDSIPHPPFIKNLTLFRKVWFPLFFFFFNYYSAMFCIDILERSNILSEAHILWSACQMNNLNLFSSSSAGSVFLLFFYYYFFPFEQVLCYQLHRHTSVNTKLTGMQNNREGFGKCTFKLRKLSLINNTHNFIKNSKVAGR